MKEKMTAAIDFFVPGIPAPQGSKTPWGTEANPNTRPWRDSVKLAALEAYKGPLIHGPIICEMTFIFPRPKAHYNAKGELKVSSPCRKASKPDLDKLVRAVGDAITDAGNIWRDDCQIVVNKIEKVFVNPSYHDHRNPGLMVEILEVGIE
jgi:Holliday junction resolvase RusA-like endonuclease